jgi:hypothetical protein
MSNPNYWCKRFNFIIFEVLRLLEKVLFKLISYFFFLDLLKYTEKLEFKLFELLICPLILFTDLLKFADGLTFTYMSNFFNLINNPYTN